MEPKYLNELALQELGFAQSLVSIRTLADIGIQRINNIARQDWLADQRTTRFPSQKESLDSCSDSITDRILRTADEMTFKGLSRDVAK
ncbi:hypothetical protein [Glutamicibacter sp. NPDC087344]|uniref:hypothetical protein n=1 Tax=Glutamicibacter sp. NPDC087344 TaxID=3363994 RepID=UPI003825C828